MNSPKPRYDLNDLRRLMARLRDPDLGCPWDLKQNYSSIVASTIEEAYEVADAIERDDTGHLREELGDLLFQVIFYCQLGEEDGYFSLDQVVDTVTAKLIARHPHVFPDGTLESISRIDCRSALDVKQQWESLKRQERENQGKVRLLDDVPTSLPAMTRALKLQKRAASVGFDWDDADGVLEKVQEELHELQDPAIADDSSRRQEELGDLFFSLVNLARHWKLDPETCLRSSNRKFAQRFRFIEDQFAEEGRQLEAGNRKLMDQYWEKAKGNVESQ